jgi:tetratricopeptide (TPR) repeat protein
MPQYRVLGEEHPDTLLTTHNLAVLYRDQGRHSLAEPLFAKELEIRRRILGEEHADTVGAMYSLAKLYLLQRKYELAEPLYIKVLRIERGVMNSETVWWLAMGDLAFLYFDERKYQQSEALLRNALNDPREIKADGGPRYNYESLLGANLAGQKRYPEAEPLLLSGYRGMLNQEAAIPPSRRSALEQGGSRIVLLYEAWGRPQKATEWRQKLQLPGPRAALGSQ